MTICSAIFPSGTPIPTYTGTRPDRLSDILCIVLDYEERRALGDDEFCKICDQVEQEFRSRGHSWGVLRNRIMLKAAIKRRRELVAEFFLGKTKSI